MKKSTFREIRSHYNIPSKEIADLAGVRLMHEYRMEIGVPVSTSFAERILHAFSLLTRKLFQLDDMDITLIEDCRTEKLEIVKVRLCK